jgi:hypothetical protein
LVPAHQRCPGLAANLGAHEAHLPRSLADAAEVLPLRVGSLGLRFSVGKGDSSVREETDPQAELTVHQVALSDGAAMLAMS